MCFYRLWFHPTLPFYFFVKNFFSNVYNLVNTIFECSYLSFGWEIGLLLSMYVTRKMEGMCITASGNILACGNILEKLFMATLETIELLTFWYIIAAHHIAQLRILTGKKHPKIKLQRLRKIRIWTFGSLVHEINSF